MCRHVKVRCKYGNSVAFSTAFTPKGDDMWTGIGYTLTALFAGESAWMYIILNAVASVGSAVINATGVNFYLDCAEYQLYQTGEDNRTFAMSMFGVAIKLQFVVLGFVVGWILNTVGYNEIAQTVAYPDLIVKYATGTTAVLYFVSSILMFMYRITDDKALEYAKANAERMQQQM